MTTQEVFQSDHERTVEAIKVQIFCRHCQKLIRSDYRFPSPDYRNRDWQDNCLACQGKIDQAKKDWPVVRDEYRQLSNRVTSKRQQTRKYPENTEALAELARLEAELAKVNYRRLEIKRIKQGILQNK